MALALFASTAFAAPLSVAASLSEPADQTVSSGASTDIDALFADVAAVPLTDIEAQAVEGEGIISIIFAAASVAAKAGILPSIIGGAIGGVIGVCEVISNGASPWMILTSTLAGSSLGYTTGYTFGFIGYFVK